MVRASAPGKCILFGEHAVLYGQPAVAVAIEQRCNVTIKDSKDDEWYLEGLIFKPEKHPHIDGLRKRLWNRRQPLTIAINSEVPSGSGLGSSAALSVAMSTRSLALPAPAHAIDGKAANPSRVAWRRVRGLEGKGRLTFSGAHFRGRDRVHR
mgnify:CR=1 FL=1